MGGRLAVAPAVAIWTGLLLGQGLDPPWSVGIAILAAALAALGLRARGRAALPIFAAACLAAGAARGAAHALALDAAEARIGDDPRPVRVRGRVSEHPWIESGEAIAVLTVRDAEGRLPPGARIRARLPPGADAEWGDRVEVMATLEAARPRRSPGGFSAREAARAQAIAGQGRVIALRRLDRGESSLARATISRWRRGIEDTFRRQLSPSAREIVTPLVVGDRTGMGPELGARFQAAGLTHLLALSGLHVVWMVAVARGLAALLGAGNAGRAWAGAVCALFYVGIAGPLPSLARAAATEGIAAWARARDRALDPVQALAVSAIGILSFAPGWARDLGFQLSCAATLGLVTIGAAGSRRLAGLRPPVLRAAARAAMPTLAAQLTALPLMLDRFHALPWTALGANLIAVPISELLLAAAWLGALVEAAAPGAAGWAFGACEALAALLRGVAGRAAEAPWALWPTGHSATVPWIAGAGAALLAGSLAGPRDVESAPSAPGFVRACATGMGSLAVAVALLLAATARPLLPPPDRWWIVVLDVGQGDAIALGFPDGWWLVDAGPASPRFDAGRATVLPFFRWAAVRGLDTMVLTHAHADHVGGAAAVLDAMRAARCVLRAGMRAPAGAVPWTIRTAARGDTLRAIPPVVIAGWPPRGAPIGNENATSLALEAGAGRCRALLAADVDSAVEAALATEGPIALLKAAHHGAGSSSGAEALARLRPRLAAVSCGRRNPFGHPDPGALARLARAGAETHRTDREGTLWFEIGPDGAALLDWRSPAFGSTAAPDPAGDAGARRAATPTRPAPAIRAPVALAGAPARW